jgi:exonuclease SbcC
MRFHKLALSNLNSLAGEHVVDFDALTRGAGLFLIHGPTGAGKSTILDAICLALFGQTPRLGDTGKETRDGVDEGASDESAARVLTVGAGECRVVLEVSVVDEQGTRTHFRAGWSVQRAHGRPDGKFQAPQRMLEELVHGSWQTLVSSTKKTDVVPAFDRMLRGLSFVDFQRTILLAQFKFREFLEADVKARTAILERMTDSEKFRRIGQLANAERRRAEEVVRSAQEGLEHLRVLSDDERAALDEQEAAARASVLSQNAAVGQLRDVQGFWRKMSSVNDRLARIESSLAATVSQRDLARERFLAWAEDARVAPARAAFLSVKDAQSNAATADERCRVSLAAQALAHTQEETARHVAERAQALYGEAQQEEAALRPDIEAARHAYQLAKESEEQAHAAGSTWARAAEELQRCSTTLVALQTTMTAEQAERAVHDGRIAAIPAAAELLSRAGAVAEQASHLQTSLAETSALDVELQAFRRFAEQHAEQRGILAAEVEVLGLEVSQAAALAAERAAAFARSYPEASTDDALHRWDAERLRADALVDRLTSLAQIVARDESLAAEQGALAQEEARLVARRDECLARQAVVEAQRRAADEALTETTANRQTVEALLAVLAHRHVLRDREPCPVCGSEDHPWVLFPERAPQFEAEQARQATLAARWVQERERVEQLTAELSSTEREVGATEAQASLVRQQGAERAVQRASVQGERRQRAQEAGVAATLSAVEVDAVLAKARDDREAVQRRLQGYLDLQSALLEAREREQAATQRRQQAERALQEHDQIAAQRGTRLAELQGQANARREALVTAQTRLRALVTPLHLDDDDLAVAAQKVAERAAVLLRLQEARQAIDERVRSLEPQCAAAQTALSQAELREAEARQAAEASTTAAKSARVAAEQRLDGLQPDRVQARLTNLLDERRRDATVDGEALADARNVLAAAEAEGKVHAQHARDALAQASAAQQAFADVLAGLGLSSIADVERCTLSAEERASIGAERERLAQEEQTAQTLWAAAQAERSSLVDELPPGESLDVVVGARLTALASSLAQAEASLAEAQRALGGFEKARDDDDAARRRGRDRAAALVVAQGELDHWTVLDDLIGTATGERFATVVQALHLQQVIAHANENLARFMDRYELLQVIHQEEGPLLDFRVVDKHQQGAIRSIRSLSGGESFIVSLALALGLSAMRSSRLRIETLFIDEGFGSLDPHMLGVAQRALQSLQAAIGVQIGVISHVELLKDEIPVRLVVEPVSAGRSQIRVVSS